MTSAGRYIVVLMLLPLSVSLVGCKGSTFTKPGQIWKSIEQRLEDFEYRPRRPPNVQSWYERIKSWFVDDGKVGSDIEIGPCWCQGYPPAMPPSKPLCRSGYVAPIACGNICMGIDPTTLAPIRYNAYKWVCD